MELPILLRSPYYQSQLGTNWWNATQILNKIQSVNSGKKGEGCWSTAVWWKWVKSDKNPYCVRSFLGKRRTQRAGKDIIVLHVSPSPQVSHVDSWNILLYSLTGHGHHGQNTLCNIIDLHFFFLFVFAKLTSQRMTLEDAHLPFTEWFGKKQNNRLKFCTGATLFKRVKMALKWPKQLSPWFRLLYDIQHTVYMNKNFINARGGESPFCKIIIS